MRTHILSGRSYSRHPQKTAMAPGDVVAEAVRSAMHCPKCWGDGFIEVIERDGSSELYDCDACLQVNPEVAVAILNEGAPRNFRKRPGSSPLEDTSRSAEEAPAFFEDDFWSDVHPLSPRRDPEPIRGFTQDDIPSFDDLR